MKGGFYMGFRFRKSVKIAPGVKLNLNKNSTSISFGGKGVRHTINSNGRRTSSIGIPGSGLYYTKSTSTKKSNNIKDDIYSDENPYYEVEDFNNFIYNITSFHKQCDYDFDWERIENDLPPFNLNEKGPNELQAIKKLNDYKPNILEKIFKNKQKKKTQKLKDNINTAKSEDKVLYNKWEKQNELAKSILEGDLNSYSYILEDIKFSNNLAGFIPSFVFKTSNSKSIIIEYDLNIENIVPKQYKTLTKTEKLSIRNYTKTDYYKIVQQYVSSFTIRIARNMFGLLPVETVVINTQTNVLDTEVGNIKNITILSIIMDRNTLNKLNFNLIDPFDALNNFKHNVRFLKTKGFQEVEKIEYLS